MLDTTAAATITQVLADLDRSLAAGDPEAAAALFEPDGYWRDLVSFTWNIRTMEGRAEIAAMLEAQLAAHRAARLDRHPPASRPRTAAALQAWIDFETAAGRGHGHIRVRGRQDLDPADHAERAQGPRGAAAASPVRKGVEHGREPVPQDLGRGPRDEEARPRPRRPALRCVIIGGGQGGIALGARLRQLDVPTIIIEKQRRARATAGASATSRSACTTRSGTTTCPTSRSRENWPVFSPKDKIGDWLEMYTKRDGAQLLGARPTAEAATLRRDAGQEWGSTSTATARRSRCARSSSCSPPACRASPTCPTFPGMDSLQGRAAAFHASTPVPTPRRARRSSSSAPTTPPTTSARRSGRPVPT